MSEPRSMTTRAAAPGGVAVGGPRLGLALLVLAAAQLMVVLDSRCAVLPEPAGAPRPPSQGGDARGRVAASPSACSPRQPRPGLPPACTRTGGSRWVSPRQHPEPPDYARPRSPIPAAPSTSALSAPTCAQSSTTARGQTR